MVGKKDLCQRLDLVDGAFPLCRTTTKCLDYWTDKGCPYKVVLWTLEERKPKGRGISEIAKKGKR